MQLSARGGVFTATDSCPHVMYRASNGEDVSLFVLNGAERKPDDLVTLRAIARRSGHETERRSCSCRRRKRWRLTSASRYVMMEARRASVRLSRT